MPRPKKAPLWEAVLDRHNIGDIVVRRSSDLEWLIKANPAGTRFRPSITR